MMRWILMVGTLALLGVGAALYFLSGNLDHIVREQIEAQGSAALGTPVHVGSVELDLRQGKGLLRDLRIENPPGFSGGDLLDLGSITLAIDVKSALAVVSGRSRHLIIDEVSVESPQANVILQGDGSSNLMALKDATSSKSAPSGAESDASAPLRLTLERVSMARVEINADTQAVDGKHHQLELSDFEMRGVGGSEGSPPGEVGATLAQAFATRLAQRVASRAAIRQLDRAIDTHLGGEAGKAAKGLLDGLLGGS